MAEASESATEQRPGEARTTGTASGEPAAPPADRVHTWPHLVRLEMMVALVVMAGLTLWSILVDAPLEQPASPTTTPNPSKAPWYFLGLQELLFYFDPWFAGVALPALIIVGLMLIPYLDVNPRGAGYYCWRDRRFAVGTFLFGFLGLWVAAILVGTFLRGPGWYFFWPWERWDPHKSVALINVDLAEKLGVTDARWAALLGAGCVLSFLFGPPLVYWRRRRRSPTLRRLGRARYWTTALLFMTMLGVVVKIALRLGFGVKYIMAGPMGFNI